MAIRITRPPITDDLLERSRWEQRVYKRLKGEQSTSGDAAASIGNNATYHGVTALTAPRTVTLPSADDLQDGDELVIKDESGAAGTHTITISRSGSDTIDGGTSTSISSNYGTVRLIKRGAASWWSA